MCDITPVRNALLLLGAALALAASSAVFGLAFANAGFLIALMYVGLGAAIGWSVGAAVLIINAMNALNVFCACASGKPACAAACLRLRVLLGIISTALLVLIAACAAKIITPVSAPAALTIVVVTTLLTVALFLLLAFGLDLGGCQTAAAPPPPRPPTGSGTAPAPG